MNNVLNLQKLPLQAASPDADVVQSCSSCEHDSCNGTKDA